MQTSNHSQNSEVVAASCSSAGSDKVTVKKSRKEYYKSYYQERRLTRDKYLEIAKKAFASSEYKTVKKQGNIGFLGFRLEVDVDKETFKFKRMPPEFNIILKACQEFIGNPRRFPNLNSRCLESANRKDSRENLAKVLVVLLARTQLIEGRIGIPSKEGLTTISEHALICDYVLRWGEMIHPSKLTTYINLLKDAGYIVYTEIKCRIEAENLSNDDSQIRSIAAYKQWTNQFFVDLKLTKDDLINGEKNKVLAMIKTTRERDIEERGYQFKWIAFTDLTNRLKRYLNAEKLNTKPPLPMHLELFKAFAEPPSIH